MGVVRKKSLQSHIRVQALSLAFIEIPFYAMNFMTTLTASRAMKTAPLFAPILPESLQRSVSHSHLPFCRMWLQSALEKPFLPQPREMPLAEELNLV